MRPYERSNRRPARSQQHDYDRPGAYFVTICAFGRESVFGTVSDGDMLLDESGRIVETCWWQLPQRFQAVTLDAFIVMPNHIHGIIVLSGGDPYRMPALHSVVGAFKADAARRINNVHGVHGVPVWQRSFHDQIIRDDQHRENVRRYISTNPANWHVDEDNPTNLK